MILSSKTKDKQRTLVTGGAGFIGSHLVDVLLQRGEAVTVFDDFSTGSLKNLSEASAKDLRVIKGSVLDLGKLLEAMEDCGHVYHLAVQCVRRSLGDPLGNHEVNATGTINALEAARQCAVNRFVYCSSSEVYGNASEDILIEDKVICNPVTVYGAAKFAGELYTAAYAQTYGMKATIVRPFNAYGPRSHQTGDLAEVIPRFVIKVLNGLPPLIFGDGTNARDFTYVTEVSRGIALAGAAEQLVGQKINIARGQMVSVKEVAHTVIRVCGRNDIKVQYASERPGDVHKLHADTSKAQRMLGYRADVRLEEGVNQYVEWVRSSYPDPRMLLEEAVENWRQPPRPRERS